MCSSAQRGFCRDFLGPDIGVPMILRPFREQEPQSVDILGAACLGGRWVPQPIFCAYLCFTISLVMTEVTRAISKISRRAKFMAMTGLLSVLMLHSCSSLASRIGGLSAK